MSDDTTFVNVPDLRGWAKTWDWMSTHLTEQEKVHNTTLIGLDMSLWNAAAAEIDKAAGELLRSGIYTTFVANAAEVADGGEYTVDHIGFATAIFGAGGALSAADERVYSNAINDDDRDLTGGGFGAPPPTTFDAPAPPRSVGSRPDAPVWTTAPAASTPADRAFDVDTADAVLQPRVPFEPTPADRVFEVDTTDAVLRPSVPFEPTPADRVFEVDTTDAVLRPSVPPSVTSPDPVFEARPTRPVYVGLPDDTPTDHLPPVDQGRTFDDGGHIVGPVLPTLERGVVADVPAYVSPGDLGRTVEVDVVAGVVKPDAAGGADERVRTFDDGGHIVGPVLQDRPVFSHPQVDADVDLDAASAEPRSAATSEGWVNRVS